jgi:3',5'-cyclic AMP phosphodiesterase CpdA
VTSQDTSQVPASLKTLYLRTHIEHQSPTRDSSAIRTSPGLKGLNKILVLHPLMTNYARLLATLLQVRYQSISQPTVRPGKHFDNVSDPGASVGESQLNWLKAELKQQKADARIVVLTHRPLFDLYPDWDWSTKDGAAVIDALMPHKNVTVFYGHIHQENHHMTGHIAHHSAKSLMFPLPAPGSVPKKAPVPWDASAPYKGLGLRSIEAEPKQAKYEIKELNVTGA